MLKTICFLLGLSLLCVTVVAGGVVSTLAILHGDMGGWSFWIGAGTAALLIYGSRV